MTKSQHTPTPWDICESENSNLVHIETSLEHPTLAGEQIATVNKGNKETRLANAALIVKAVNNHQSLIDALETLLHSETVDRRDYEQAETTLKTAKGE